MVTKVIGPVNVMLQRSKRAHPFCTHVDKLKPYEADVMPASWLQGAADDATPNANDADASSDGNQEHRTRGGCGSHPAGGTWFAEPSELRWCVYP